jgi:hypothetical protein
VKLVRGDFSVTVRAADPATDWMNGWRISGWR